MGRRGHRALARRMGRSRAQRRPQDRLAPGPWPPPRRPAGTGQALTSTYRWRAGLEVPEAFVPRPGGQRCGPRFALGAGPERARTVGCAGDGSGTTGGAACGLSPTTATGKTHQPGGERIQWTGLGRFCASPLDEPPAPTGGGANDGASSTTPWRPTPCCSFDQGPDPATPQGTIAFARPPTADRVESSGFWVVLGRRVARGLEQNSDGDRMVVDGWAIVIDGFEP